MNRSLPDELRLGQAGAASGGALLGIAPGLGEIAANNVASIADLDLLDLSSVKTPEARGTTNGTKGV